MKLIGLFLFLGTVCTTYAQTILNGDFEDHSAVTDQINLTNSAYDAIMNNSNAFGSWGGGGLGGGDMDIITTNTYCGYPQNGNWHVAFTAGGTDAISLDLSAPLVMGNSYTISFWDRACSSYVGAAMQIGVSNSDTDMGTIVYTAPTPIQNGIWTQRTFTFVAPFAATYITVTCDLPVSGSMWTQFDNISFDCSAPTPDLGNDTMLCNGSNLMLDVTDPLSTFVWQDGSTDPTFNVTGSGTYYVDVTNGCGTGTDTIVVTDGILPSVNLGNDTLICQAGTLTLDASNPNSTYLWQDNSVNATFTASQTGTYSVDVTNACGTASDDINITFGVTGSVSFGNDTTLCQGNSLLLDATIPNSTYLWQDNSTGATLNVNSPGTYYVDVTNICGSSSDTIVISYEVVPVVELGNDTIICQGGSLLLDATSANSNYLWQDNSTNATLNVTQSGLYSVDVSNYCGTVSDQINITLGTIPTIDLGNDTSFCEGGILVLDATNLNANYLWQDNSTNPTFTVSQDGTYWVTASNACGADQDTITVNYSPALALELGPDLTICDGGTYVLSPSIPNSTYLWQDGSTNTTYYVTTGGLYYVTVTSGTCVASDSIIFVVDDLPEIELGGDMMVCAGETVVISALQPPTGSYQWNTGSSEPQITVSTPGDYFLTVSNACGTDSDTLSLGMFDCSCSIYLPNSFTPDGDEFNQLFRPKYDCDFYRYELYIYNRWGEEIFFTYDPNEGWDGTYKGVAVPTGAYTYIVYYESDYSIVHMLEGGINVLR